MGRGISSALVAPTQALAAADEEAEGADDEEAPDRGWGWETEPAEEELHEEARRQARLLVTEIKLYHEEAVEEGRKSGNIYDRLRGDIDRSRQLS